MPDSSGYSWTFWIAVYGAVVATASLVWNVVKHFIENVTNRKERRKIFVRFGITILKRGVPKIEEFHVFPLCITNLGRADVIITNVEMRRKNSKFHPGAYNEPEAMLGIYGERMLPRRLQPGETVTLEQFTLAAFHDCPDEVVVFDAEGREYKVPDSDLKNEFEEAQRYKRKMETNSARSADNP